MRRKIGGQRQSRSIQHCNVKLLANPQLVQEIVNSVKSEDPKVAHDAVERSAALVNHTDTKDGDCRTPLWVAAQKGAEPTIKVLLEARADVDSHRCTGSHGIQNKEWRDFIECSGKCSRGDVASDDAFSENRDRGADFVCVL